VESGVDPGDGEQRPILELQDMVAKNSEAQRGCPVTYTYTRREARQLLERHGFRVTGVQAEHIFPYRIAEYVKYRCVKE
jgi:hypothetical protein